MNWEKEKAYCATRAKALTEQMEAAIEANDKERFVAAYETSARYMTKKQRKPYYIRFIKRRIQA